MQRSDYRGKDKKNIVMKILRKIVSFKLMVQWHSVGCSAGKCPVQWRSVGYSAGKCPVQQRSVGYSADKCPVQWRSVGSTVLVSALYSGVQWSTVEVSRTIQTRDVQSTYSGCQTMSLNFREYQWILNSVVIYANIIKAILYFNKEKSG